tara:strand:+ start:1621 stop:1971 length:351 start_codon:yes stop_codon:yes gene_type:complete
MTYPEIEEYVTAIYNVYIIVNRKAQIIKNDKLAHISRMILNYYLESANNNGLMISNVPEVDDDDINLMPIFRYIAHYEIELYELSNMKDSDLDIENKADIERFVLSHIYYLTQKQG